MKSKIVFIGGGNMAEGIIKGLINTETMDACQITVSEIIKERRKYLKETYRINVVEESSEAVKDADIIFLATRPQNAEESVVKFRDFLNENKIFISICAGVDIARMQRWTSPEMKIAKIMPNVLIETRHGYSGVCVSDKITEEDKEVISKLCGSIGQTLYIPESMFNEFTAYSCAGPAYVMYFLAGLIDAGVESGFSRKDAAAMAIENLIGSGMTISETGKNPYQITDTMTSPAGVTIEGCHVLSSAGFQGIVMNAVRASVRRANEL